MKNALIIVDLQEDFMPGGPLGVPGAREIVPLVNQLQQEFDVVVATQDWHPEDHGSFAENHEGRELYEQVQLNGFDQTLWPVHCVQETMGAAMANGLETGSIDAVFQKGIEAGIDSYSGFFDNGQRRATGLHDYLTDRNVKAVYIAGVATDYCVCETALDATRLGFETWLIEDACRGVEVRSSDITSAINRMKEAGVRLTTTRKILQPGETR